MTSTMFDEHLGVMQALKENYARADDRTAVCEVLRLQHEAAATLGRSEDEVRRAIRGLTERVEEARKRTVYPKSEDEHGTQVTSLKVQAAAAKDTAEALRERLGRLGEERRALDEELGTLRARSRRLSASAAQGEPQIRHELSLYAHVSGISWRFDKAGRVAGEVATDDDVRLFDFDAASDGVTNDLWDLVG